MTLATVQNLRSFTAGEHPTDLEPGQIAFNLSQDNWSLEEANANIFIYVGNQTDLRLDEDGTVLVEGGTDGKGWIRYSLRSARISGDDIYGDLSVVGASVTIRRSTSSFAELVIPKTVDTPLDGSLEGSVRWNPSKSILQAWDGSKWDSTSKVSVSDTPPLPASNGDLWLTPTSPAKLYVYVVPSVGPASWVLASTASSASALQPGNGVSANSFNQIEIIDQGPF